MSKTLTTNALVAAMRVFAASPSKTMPDIHLYLDYSGGIIDDDHERAVRSLIEVAHITEVALYVTTYNHQIEHTVELDIDPALPVNNEVEYAWERIVAIPKDYGGTDYEVIWQRINNSKTYAEQLSINVTDFQWFPSSDCDTPHPEHLYYTAIDTYSDEAAALNREQFIANMSAVDDDIASKILYRE